MSGWLCFRTVKVPLAWAVVVVGAGEMVVGLKEEDLEEVEDVVVVAVAALMGLEALVMRPTTQYPQTSVDLLSEKVRQVINY